MKFKSKYKYRLVDTETRELLKEGDFIIDRTAKNLITNQGVDYFQGCVLNGNPVTLYFSLYSGTYTPVETETAATYPANAVEITSAYSQPSRPVCNLGKQDNTLYSIDSGEFTFTTSVTVKGLAIATSSVKGGTTGAVISIANDEAGGLTVSNGTTLLVDWDSEWGSNVE